MALDTFARVVTIYKADIDDQVRGLEKLKGAERERAQASIDAAKATSASLGDHLKSINKVRDAYGEIQRVATAFWDGYEQLQERRRVTDASGHADIEKLRAASRGLKTDLELLQAAALRNSGTFRLTNEQFAIAERAVAGLTMRGVEYAKANEAVNKAITALNTGGLKELGHGLDLNSEKLKTSQGQYEEMQRVFAHLSKLGAEAGDGQKAFGREAEQAIVSFRNSWDKVKEKMGEVVEALGPVLLGLAKLVELAGKIGTYAGTQEGLREVSRDAVNSMIDNANLNTEAQRMAFSGETIGTRARGTRDTVDPRVGLKGNWAEIIDKRNEREKGEEKAASDELLRRSQAAGEALLAGVQLLTGSIAAGVRYMEDLDAEGSWADNLKRSTWTPNLLAAGRGNSALGTRASGGGGDVVGRALTALNGKDYASSLIGRRNAGAYDDYSRGKATSLLEQAMGPLDQFSAYQSAWGALSSSVVAGYEAMVTGSMSFGQAFKATLGQALLATGKEMSVMALKETAYGIGSLALGPLGGASAAQHFAAAAAFGVGALAAGVAAHELGAGGSAAAPASVRSGAASAVSSTTDARERRNYQGRNEIIVLGDSFGDNTSRAAQHNLRRRVADAMGSAGVEFK